MSEPSVSSGETSPRRWTLCGKSDIPKKEIIFFSQVILIYVVVVGCIINLSLDTGCCSTVWASMLSGCLGYLLPSPSFRKKRRNESFLPNPN